MHRPILSNLTVASSALPTPTHFPPRAMQILPHLSMLHQSFETEASIDLFVELGLLPVHGHLVGG